MFAEYVCHYGLAMPRSRPGAIMFQPYGKTFPLLDSCSSYHVRVGPERFVDETVEFKLHSGIPTIKIIVDLPAANQREVRLDSVKFKEAFRGSSKAE